MPDMTDFARKIRDGKLKRKTLGRGGAQAEEGSGLRRLLAGNNPGGVIGQSMR